MIRASPPMTRYSTTTSSISTLPTLMANSSTRGHRTEWERGAAEDAKADLAASGVFSAPIATAILPTSTFYAAEEYHQDYHRKNPVRYAYYRANSGRDTFLMRTWTPEAKQKYVAVRIARPTAVPTAPSATPSRRFMISTTRET